jgi:hypothetical protein
MSFSPSVLAADFTVIRDQDYEDVLTVTREVESNYNPGGHSLVLHVTARDGGADLIVPAPQLQVISSTVQQQGATYQHSLTARLILTAAQIAVLSPQTLYDYRVVMTDSNGRSHAAAHGWLLVQEVG